MWQTSCFSRSPASAFASAALESPSRSSQPDRREFGAEILDSFDRSREWLWFLLQFFLKMGFEPSCVYAVNLLSSIFVITLNLFLLKKQINDILILPILRTILVTIVVSTLTALLICFVHISMDEGLIRFAIVTISDVLSMIILTYFIALNDSQRSYIKRFITQKLLLKNEM